MNGCLSASPNQPKGVKDFREQFGTSALHILLDVLSNTFTSTCGQSTTNRPRKSPSFGRSLHILCTTALSRQTIVVSGIQCPASSDLNSTAKPFSSIVIFHGSRLVNPGTPKNSNKTSGRRPEYVRALRLQNFNSTPQAPKTSKITSTPQTKRLMVPWWRYLDCEDSLIW